MTINLDQYTNTLNVTDTATNADLNVTTKGTGAVRFNTGGGLGFRVSEAFLTGTAVNYIDASGRQTGLGPILSVNGSDTNVRFNITSKGSEAVGIYTNLANQLQFNVAHTASAVNYIQATGSATGAGVTLSAQGSDSNVQFYYVSKGTFPHSFLNSAGNEQFRIASTASAVNYVNVTGALTGASPNISAQGSDTNIQIQLQAKGTGLVRFATGGGLQAYVSDTVSPVNYVSITGAATGGAPTISVQGSDTNIDLAFTPKGTGNVRFGTYTANMALTIQGYVEIKDSGGTVRRLAVIA
jgi:hypothetical protein